MMSRPRVLAFAVLAALAIVFVPLLIPTGPTTVDPSALLASGQFLFAAGVIFVGGLLTSLTPCVYPLIPITVSVFGARQADSRGRAFVLTSAYVVGMGVVFSTLGVVAALSGKAFGSALGNKWLIVALAVFLVILASSMFGAFDLALPSGLATKLNNVGGGGVLGALLMGSVAGFIAAPCTGPALFGVLAFVSRTQNPVLGGLLLFIYALGMGVPFFLIGVFTARLPKSGAWMDSVKSVFGVLLLMLAAGYLRDGFEPFREALLAAAAVAGKYPGVALAALLTFGGVALGAIHLSFKEGRQWLPKGVGVAALVAAFLLRMSLESVAAPQPPPGGTEPASFEWAVKLKPETTTDLFDAALAKAKHDCKPVMIDFFAEWCAACNELDKHTYVAKDVIDESHRFMSIKVDGTTDTDALNALYERFGVQGLPTVAFVSPTGQVLDSPRVVGFLKPEQFVGEMRKVAITTCAASP